MNKSDKLKESILLNEPTFEAPKIEGKEYRVLALCEYCEAVLMTSHPFKRKVLKSKWQQVVMEAPLAVPKCEECDKSVKPNLAITFKIEITNEDGTKDLIRPKKL